MPIYDYECECGKITERIAGHDEVLIDCECGGIAKRIISASGQFCANEDAAWIRSVLEVVDRESTERHTREFIANPTRKNYRRWMQGEGLRPLENGEGRKRDNGPNMERIKREVIEKHIKRNRIEIRGTA